MTLSPAKALLLAAHCAAQGEVDNLTAVFYEHFSTARQELFLRILLTYLPETIQPSSYIPLLKVISGEEEYESNGHQVDVPFVAVLSEEKAEKQAKKLRLLQLRRDASLEGEHGEEDPLVRFLIQRAYRMNSETGLLSGIPQLLLPFVDRASAFRTWVLATMLPFYRRCFEYYPADAGIMTLAGFEKMPPETAISFLLARTSSINDAQLSSIIERDLGGLIGPWVYDEKRWELGINSHSKSAITGLDIYSAGWEHFLELILAWGSGPWKVLVAAVEHWNGPTSSFLGEKTPLELQKHQESYLIDTWHRLAIAGAYSITDPSFSALQGAYRICTKILSMKDHRIEETLESISIMPETLSPINFGKLRDARYMAYLRNDLLHAANVLTTPTIQSLLLLRNIIISAAITTKFGVSWTIRQTGDLFLLQDAREQKAELGKLMRFIASQESHDDDTYWADARKQLLWLRNWGGAYVPNNKGWGPLGSISNDELESEILKALLGKTRYRLAKLIYEDEAEKPLSAERICDITYNAALNAFDNATNPNRKKGGLKKCDDIIHTFPTIVTPEMTSMKKIEALLRATHALSSYRLVLKQGEPFSPVVLRVHSDPVAIIERVLGQNAKSYTRLQEFLEVGMNMVKAGVVHMSATMISNEPASEATVFLATERRIVAMCIEAALREEDFETAYSYVVSRMDTGSGVDDPWSWEAALKAGQYMRTEQSQQPTHLGTASGNLEIRHLEQRIECLATALRVAPPNELQQILNTFRRCEEQLDSVMKEEAANEAAWEAAPDTRTLPGAFHLTKEPSLSAPRNMIPSATTRQTEEAPMSLFDLSRATARIAQRNFTSLSTNTAAVANSTEQESTDESSQRQRKRDQLRNAATGTLVSGVGWLIGANMSNNNNET